MKSIKNRPFSRSLLIPSVAAAAAACLPFYASAQLVFNGEHNIVFVEQDWRPNPIFVAYGPGENATLNITDAWLTFGPGSRIADSTGAGTNNNAVINLNSESRLTLGWDEDGLADIIGYDGTVVINVDGTVEPWLLEEGILRTQRATLAVEPGSSATVNIFGPYGIWSARTRHIDVGLRGDGAINLTDGGRIIDAQRLAIGGSRWTATSGGENPYAPIVDGTGSLLVDGAGSAVVFANNSNAWLRVGRRGTGTAIVRNGGLIDLASNTIADGLEIYVGDLAGGDGELIIESGGVVRSNGVFRVNSTGSDRGYVRVDGPGSLLNIDLEGRTSLSFIGNNGADENSEGVLEVVNGGRANFSASVRFGNVAGTFGRLLVDGAGSEMNVGTFLQAGWFGTGEFQVRNGGQLNVQGLTTVSAIGRQVDSQGTLIVEGQGSKASYASVLLVGSGDAGYDSVGTGAGTVEILNGGLLEVGQTLAVRGQSSVLLNGGTIRMGTGGEMSISGPNTSLSGQGVIDGDLFVGNGAAVAGSGSEIIVEGTLSGEGVAENLTVGGVRASFLRGPLTLRNIQFLPNAVVNVSIDIASEVESLLLIDGTTDVSGTHLNVTVDTFITDVEWTSRILAPGVSAEFATITLPDYLSLNDGVLTVTGELPQPPPALVSIYTRGGTNDTWTTLANWNTSFFPDAWNHLAEFSQTVNTDRINMLAHSTLISVPTVHQTAGILVRESFVATPVAANENFLFRNLSTSTFGTLRLHGFDMTIDGNPARGLVANFSNHNISFTTNNQSFQIQLAGSGHFHVEKPNVQTRVIVGITEIGGSQSIVKTGAGILHFGASSQNSDFSGGFVLRGGIVEWTNSGSGSASPFGRGPLTLQGGGVRSNGTGARSIFAPVVLDGSVEFGSVAAGTNGNITVSSAGGNPTTISSDSTLIVHNTTTWAQAIDGEGGLTKQGAGTLFLSGVGGPVTHTGPTVVEAGTLRVNTAIWESPLTIKSGATLAFGTATIPGTMVAGDSLTLESGSTIVFRINGAETYDSAVVEGPVTLGGANVQLSLGYQPGAGAIVLIENLSGTPVTGGLTFNGVELAEGAELTITTGEFSQEFTITYQHFGHSVALLPVGLEPESPYLQWAGSWGLTGANAAPGANPAGDGFTNVEKFAFGANPNVAVPSLAQVTRDGANLILRWNRSTYTGIQYVVESSSDLIAWSPVADANPVVMTTPDVTPPAGYQRVEWSASTATGARSFYRVRAVVDPSLLP